MTKKRYLEKALFAIQTGARIKRIDDGDFLCGGCGEDYCWSIYKIIEVQTSFWLCPSCYNSLHSFAITELFYTVSKL
jgi:hypothetical protein